MEGIYALIEKSHEGDKEARNQLVEANLGLVWSIVRRFENRGYDLEDLFQIGSIGLLKAIDKFDITYEVKFSTYAVPLITGEIKRFLRDDGMIKVSRTLKENAGHIRQAKERLEYHLGREATMEELAKETKLSIEDLVMSLEAQRQVESLQKPITGEDGKEVSMEERIGMTKGNNQRDQEKEELLDKIAIDQALEGLELRQKRLIVLRYFEDKTQMEVARALGISQVQVSRLEKKTLLELRKFFPE